MDKVTPSEPIRASNIRSSMLYQQRARKRSGNIAFSYKPGLAPAKQHFSPGTKQASISTMPLKTTGWNMPEFDERWQEIN
jgi:hypothetical protein